MLKNFNGKKIMLKETQHTDFLIYFRKGFSSSFRGYGWGLSEKFL